MRNVCDNDQYEKYFEFSFSLSRSNFVGISNEILAVHTIHNITHTLAASISSVEFCEIFAQE